VAFFKDFLALKIFSGHSLKLIFFLKLDEKIHKMTEVFFLISIF